MVGTCMIRRRRRSKDAGCTGDMEKTFDYSLEFWSGSYESCTCVACNPII